TYDTLQASRSGDFGYGWRLEYGNTNLKTSVGSSDFDEVGLFSPFQDFTRVYVTVPGGRREGFTFQPKLAPGLKGNFLGVLDPSFVADTGVTDTLSVDQYDLRRLDDGSYTDFFGSFPYNPADDVFGGRYYLTTKDGIVYTVDGTNGGLISVADRNG